MDIWSRGYSDSRSEGSSSAETALKNFKAKYPWLNMTFLLAQMQEYHVDKLPITVSMDQEQEHRWFYKNIEGVEN